MYFSLQDAVRLAHMNLCVVSDRSIFAQLKLNYQEMHRKWQSVISGNTGKYPICPVFTCTAATVGHSRKEFSSLLRPRLMKTTTDPLLAESSLPLVQHISYIFTDLRGSKKCDCLFREFSKKQIGQPMSVCPFRGTRGRGIFSSRVCTGPGCGLVGLKASSSGSVGQP